MARMPRKHKHGEDGRPGRDSTGKGTDDGSHGIKRGGRDNAIVEEDTGHREDEMGRLRQCETVERMGRSMQGGGEEDG